MKSRRRTYYIKKRFQIGFFIKFFLLLIVEAVLAVGLFMYLSRGTLTTGLGGSGFRVERTASFFFGPLIVLNLFIVVVVGVAGIIVFLFITNKIAGPLYRFEKSLEEVGRGNLTHRFNLRKADQLEEISVSINAFISRLDTAIGELKAATGKTGEIMAGLNVAVSAADREKTERLVDELSGEIARLNKTMESFKTSG